MLSAKNKIYLTLFCFSALFLGLLFWMILPLTTNLKASSYNLALQKASLSLFQEKLTNLEKFQEKQLTFQQYVAKIEKGFVDPKAPVEFIEFLEAEASRAGLKLKISASSFPKQEEAQYGLGFQIALAGPFSNCLRFLERLEQSPWLIEIQQVQVNRVSEEKKSGAPSAASEDLEIGDVHFNIQLRTFSPKALTQ